MRRTNFFITGKKQIGKSFLLGEVIEELGIKPSGYLTLPYFIAKKRKGFYMHSLVEVSDNDRKISIQENDYSCIPVIETFETLGVEILEQSLEQRKVIVLDEVGRLERNAPKFMKLIQNVLDSERIILGVLKKEDIFHINEIKKRVDTLVFDMDCQSQDDIKKQLINLMEERNHKYEK